MDKLNMIQMLNITDTLGRLDLVSRKVIYLCLVMES
jgi:hypothetical protein